MSVPVLEGHGYDIIVRGTDIGGPDTGDPEGFAVNEVSLALIHFR